MAKGLILWGVRSIFYVLDYKTNKEFKCVIKGKILDSDFDIKGRRETSPLVAGDMVEFTKTTNNEGVINKRYERKNEFKRLKQMGRQVQTLVANIDQLIIVDSIKTPPLRPYFIDRCLFSADIMGVSAIVVFNKIDLLDDEQLELFKEVKELYEELGYKTMVTSTVTNEGITELKSLLTNRLSSFNGRSGVGKSTLVKTLDPTYDGIKIGDVSKKFNRGTHTTTYAQIYKLAFGGQLIDTPGIRELSIYIDRAEDVEKHFRDFDSYRVECKYSNCQHIDEPGCKVLEALDNKKIHPFRYESYLRMRETILKLKDSKI